MNDFEQVGWNEQLEDDCRQIVRLAVREDLDRECDWTTVGLVDHTARGSARIVAREPGTVAGLAVAQIVVDEMQLDLTFVPNTKDGESVTPGQQVATLQGSSRDLLTGERIVLNFLGRLSGVASLTRKYVDRVATTGARIYDTRKTTPGWRRLEKHAVTLGGGTNHRTGLFSAVMIKDNHLAHCGDAGVGLVEAVKRIRAFLADAKQQKIVEVEVDTTAQFREVLTVRPDLVLLDNMSTTQLQECVALRNRLHPDIELEASGGVRLETVRAIAETGVDRISVGALTHSAVNFDLGLDWS